MKTADKIFRITLLIFSLQLFLPDVNAEVVPEVVLKTRKIKEVEYISIYDILTRLKPDYSFNFVTRRGKIFNRSSQVIYRIGYPTVLINGKVARSEAPLIQVEGEPLVPLTTGREIIKGLFPETAIRLQRDMLIISYKSENIKKEGNRKIKQAVSGPGKKDRIGFIVIDPGHGGKDPGAIGRGGIKEKSITLSISHEIVNLLKRKFRNIKVILTRKNDRFIELSRRTEIGNRYLGRYGNGLFISVHVNASISRKISGFETYFLSQNPSNEDARNTAALENNVIVLEEKSKNGKYGDIDYIEAMMITTQIQKESSMLAHSIQRGLLYDVKRFKSRGVRKADFFVLRGSLMPAVLVEVGFITNRKELRYLNSRSHRQHIARGISNGVEAFIKKYNRSLNGGS